MSVQKGDAEPQINGICTTRQSRVGFMEAKEMGAVTFIGKDRDEQPHQGAISASMEVTLIASK